MNSPTGPSHQFRLSKIGLGTATFGREINEADSFVMMDHAVAKGINHFDTASAYSKGESERIVGAWLASRRPSPGSLLVATKIWPPYSAALVQSSVEQSLRRLGVDAIDVFYYHKWDDSAPDPEVLAALDRLVREGKVRALAASNFNAEQLGLILRLQAESGFARIQSLQNNNNYAIRHIDEPLRQLCAKEGVEIITFSPLGAGFLTGKHRKGVQPGSRFDLVKNNPKNYFTDEAWRRLDRLEAVAAKYGCSSVVLAMAWALHQPGITSVLVGGRIPAQLDQAIAGLALDRAEIWRELEQE
jgi:aryl-alcohol dehydrogenase-like predicted oxidoreductase